ncbi:hypothetical protein [Brevibacillus marinus]|uniref:hypothetical protein n=1 Tax=Brevibacillus marinus TaxID=2496837 RepID=UPI000F819547|nr:hypothetical protein [Brevibacillus marinus]
MSAIVTLTLPNTPAHQQLCREIRDFHNRQKRPLTITFPEQMTRIRLEAACLYLPDQRALSAEAVIDGIVKKRGSHYEIHPRGRGKTVNLHLDPALLAELEQIRGHLSGKTQREAIRELLVRGLRSVQAEQLPQQPDDESAN